MKLEYICRQDVLEADENTTCECVKTIYKGDVQLLHCCPHCGESYYMENYSTRTAAYYPPIYKDGVNINPDRNITTVHCTCMNCKNDFSFTD